MIIRTIKQLSEEDATILRNANKETLETSEKINPYCTLLYEAITKKMLPYHANAPCWYHPIVRENIGPFEQPIYQLKDLPLWDYSFCLDRFSVAHELKSERIQNLDNLFLELNFVHVVDSGPKNSNGIDISFTIMNEKKMEDTFVEHYSEVGFELNKEIVKETLFSLANYFYNKPSLYKKTYEALKNNEKYMVGCLGQSITDSYTSMFSLEIDEMKEINFDVSKEIIDHEILFYRSDSHDLVRLGYEHLASFATFGEINIEEVQLKLNDNNLLAIDIMLKNLCIERTSTSISSKNCEEILSDPIWNSVIDKEINNWLRDIIIQANFTNAFYKRLKNIALVENV